MEKMQKLNLRMQKLNLRMQKLNLRMQKLNFPGSHWRGMALIVHLFFNLDKIRGASCVTKSACSFAK